MFTKLDTNKDIEVGNVVIPRWTKETKPKRNKNAKKYKCINCNKQFYSEHRSGRLRCFDLHNLFCTLECGARWAVKQL